MTTVYASLEYRGVALFVATNTHKTHPLQQNYYPHEASKGTHAEISILAKYLSREAASAVRGGSKLPGLHKCTMRVWRFRKDGSLAMAKPCVGCQRALTTYGLGVILYTDDQGKWINFYECF